MFDFQRYIRFLPKLFLSPQGHQQSLSLGKDPIDNAEPCYPHDNIVGSHLCDECMKSILPTVCHKPLSICWLIEQVCSLTKGCQAYQFVPGTSFSRQFVRILLTISNWFKFLFLEMVIIQVRTWDFVQLPCLFIRQLAVSFNAFLSMSFHVVRPRNSLCVSFSRLVIFSWSSLHSRWVHPKHTWSRNEVGSSRSTFFINCFHVGACFFPAISISSTYPDKNESLFSMNKKHSQFGTFSHPGSI